MSRELKVYFSVGFNDARTNFRFESLDEKLTSLNIFYSEDNSGYGISGFQVTFEDGTLSEMYGKLGQAKPKSSQVELEGIKSIKSC